MGSGEFALIDWIRRQTALDPRRVPVGPGDDCAVVAVEGQRILLTTDAFLEGTHFRLSETDPALVGRKAFAANLSDIAAMAGLPRAAVVSVGLPREGGLTIGRAVYRGMRELADAFDCPIVGGDVTSWAQIGQGPGPEEATEKPGGGGRRDVHAPAGSVDSAIRNPESAIARGPLVISIAMVGEPAGVEPVLRSGARVGDLVLVTGRLGGSLHAGRHLTFTPRVAEARALAAAAALHAMIDISDGLSSDLLHVLDESRCGAVIREADIPLHPDAVAAARTSGRPPVDHALNDGEDFELLFTTDAASARRLAAKPPVALPVTVIGEIVPAERVLVTRDGRRVPLVSGGYEHALGE